MTNAFYNDFDREELDPRPEDYRSAFQRGRDRLIHNAAFRRLQAKTQVFLSGEYDFYRTRLTHSIEVAQIAGSIARYLNSSSDQLGEGFGIDIALVEASALAHDIGHPPFGHAGEGTLHRLMKPYGGFEGNAQTLRLITEIIFTSGRSRRGMNPTRAFVDGVLKYKTLFSQWPEPVKHFIYDDQQKYLDFVFDGAPIPSEFTPGKNLNGFRSLECQIMDWADDTAYSLNDLVDSANAGFVTMDKINRWASDKDLSSEESRIIEELIAVIGAGGSRALHEPQDRRIRRGLLPGRERKFHVRKNQPLQVRDGHRSGNRPRAETLCPAGAGTGVPVAPGLPARAQGRVHAGAPVLCPAGKLPAGPAFESSVAIRGFRGGDVRRRQRHPAPCAHHLRLSGRHDRRIRHPHLQAVV